MVFNKKIEDSTKKIEGKNEMNVRGKMYKPQIIKR